MQDREEGEFVCSREVALLLANLNEESVRIDLIDDTETETERLKIEELNEKSKRVVNKFLRNQDNDYIGWNDYIKKDAIYAKEFNLLEKLKLDVPIEQLLEQLGFSTESTLIE